MNDAKVLSACLASRSAFEHVQPFIEENDHSPQSAIWWPQVVAWYARDPRATAVDVELFRSLTKRQLPPKNAESLLGWLDALPPAPSPENAVLALLELKRFNAQQDHLAAVSAGNTERAQHTWAVYESLIRATTLGGESVVFADNDSVFAPESRGVVVRVAPAGLQQRVGGMAAGDSMVVYARPEMGKTAFVVNLGSVVANDGHRVLYLGNEEPVVRTMRRFVSRLCGQTVEYCEEHWEGALAAAKRRGYDRIKFKHLEPGSLAEIEAAIIAARPNLVILDQVRNIKSRGDSLTIRLEEVQQEFRAMASRYQFAAVSVTQAGDSASGQTFLDMGDVDSSNTGLPGACDVMVGIGANTHMMETDRRGISLPKNKLGHTHESFTVTIDKARNRIQ